MRALKLLYVNDQPTANLLRSAFREAELGTVEIIFAPTEEEARDRIEEQFDVVLMDYDLGRGKNTVETGLVGAFLAQGHTVVAFSSGNNFYLTTAGCKISFRSTEPEELACWLATLPRTEP